MKLNQILESVYKVVNTETGTAKLMQDGSMVVNNSGYTQHLTPAQVQAAWSGAKRLPMSPETIADMKADGLSDDETLKYAPVLKNTVAGEFWDFGEELHVIPSKEEFISN